MARVFVDTNVLFPFSVMDLMLALTEDGIHQVIWTETLLAEWERTIVRTDRRSSASAAAITATIREYFHDSEVPQADYTPLVDDMPSNDPDDRHHIAAAVAGQAQMIITWNRADFPAGPLAALGLSVMDPDQYLCALLTELPQEVVATMVRVAGGKHRPPWTPLDLADNMAKAGVTVFAGRLRTLIEQREAPTPDGS